MITEGDRGMFLRDPFEAVISLFETAVVAVVEYKNLSVVGV